MNNIKTLYGQDIFTLDTQVILQQCNCFNTMGSGIAREIRLRYPEAYEADCKTIRGDRNKLGTITWAKSSKDGKYIINMYSQFNYGKESRKTNYEAFANGLEVVKTFMLNNKLNSLSLPHKIGCALGGGNWTIVKTMIYESFKNQPFDVCICKLTDDNHDVDFYSLENQFDDVINTILMESNTGCIKGNCLSCGQINEIASFARKNIGNENTLKELGLRRWV